jgi:hypothetical protein
MQIGTSVNSKFFSTTVECISEFLRSGNKRCCLYFEREIWFSVEEKKIVDKVLHMWLSERLSESPNIPGN